MTYLLSQLLTRSAKRWPDREAVTASGTSLTYGELDSQSNRMARALKQGGVSRGDRVAILLDKSVEALITIFGILKADAVYVPLDPGAPAARLAFILKNCGAHTLVGSSSRGRLLEEILEAANSLQALMLTGGEEIKLPAGVRPMRWSLLEEVSGALPEQRNTEADLAYILYTSGSTGDPKGVMIGHRNALAFIDWAADALDLGPGDRVSSHAPFHFDLSIFDIYATLKSGATLCLVPADVARFPAELGRWIQDLRVSVWYSVPSALVLLLQRGKLTEVDLSGVRAVLFAGEVFPSKHLRALMLAMPGAAFFNLYGPTETNVVTWFRVPQPPADDNPVPIGVACANMEVFLVDESGARVSAPDVAGEVYARSPTVARGYWGDPAKTAAAFVHNPFDPGEPAPVYRTGDLGAWDTAGNLHFLGRVDQQVKVQGYRIELGEVETSLLGHADIDEAVVLDLEDRYGTRFLKGFVVARDGCSPAADEIKRHCSRLLPAYMVPGQIEVLARLPKTSTGKVDRVALRGRSS